MKARPTQIVCLRCGGVWNNMPVESVNRTWCTCLLSRKDPILNLAPKGSVFTYEEYIA